MTEALKYLTVLPTWLLVPLSMLIVFLVLWPKFVQLYRDISARHRQFDEEKRRLELLKLRYEIEAIKKQHGLGDVADLPELPPLEETGQASPKAEPLEETGQASPRAEPSPQADKPPAIDFESRLLSAWSRFTLGALGGVLIPLSQLTAGMATSGGPPLLAAFLSIAMLGVLGGAAAVAIVPRRSTAALCLMVGLAAAAMVQSLVATTITGTSANTSRFSLAAA
jgi:hypothetical protein